jgi:hypothetical protein
MATGENKILVSRMPFEARQKNLFTSEWETVATEPLAELERKLAEYYANPEHWRFCKKCHVPFRFAGLSEQYEVYTVILECPNCLNQIQYERKKNSDQALYQKSFRSRSCCSLSARSDLGS